MGIKIGILGAGRFSRGFVRFFRDHPDVEELVICDKIPERVKEFREMFDIQRGVSSFDALCKSDVDAIAVFTQPWLHAPQAVQAMKSGKHVWSAVPLIMLPDGDEVLEWIDRIVNTSRETGMQYFMAETSHFRPGPMYCRRQLAEGAFGELVCAEGQYRHDYLATRSSLLDVAKHRWGDQFDDSKTGDTPMHYSTHSLGAVLSVVPAHVEKVSCLGWSLPDDPYFRRDTMWGCPYSNEIATMALSNGMNVTLRELRNIGTPNYEGMSIYGTQGSFITAPADNQSFWMTKSDQIELSEDEIRDSLPTRVQKAWDEGNPDGDSDYGGHGGSHAFLVHEFVDAIANDRTVAVNAWQAARYLAPGIIAHKSAMREGQWLDVPDWGDAPQR